MDRIKAVWEAIKKFFIHLYLKRRNLSKILTQVLIYALLITISYVFLFPFINMISLAFMTQADIIDVQVDFIPTSIYFGNFKAAVQVMDGFRALFNSFWFSTVLAVSQVVVSALTGYAFARYNFFGKKLLFALILISFIIPIPIIFIPRLMMFLDIQSTLGMKMIGTVIPQMLMSLFGQGVNSAILILIFFNFFKMIPNVLYEAARIDGASALNQFWHITIRMSLSTIIVVFLFSFVWNWNETYITSQLVSDNMILMPSQLGVFDSLFTSRPPSLPGAVSSPRVNEAYRMAATLMSMTPLFIIYFFAQKQFVEGIEKTGITGE